ncbi:unnamed protein product [Citrullus colocynthis]|uniref:Pectinesterase inhibitor domain-containing protein n=1 Tax=Citrullus colocynthis TaxID=252529 RepID=A0ABP0XPT5_9ROSI
MNQSLLAFFVTLLVLYPKIIVGNDNFIQDTCNKTKELKHLCIFLIFSNSHDDLKSNLTGLLTIFVNQTLLVVADDELYLSDQTLNGRLDNRTQQVFMNCMTQYQMSKDSLQGLLEEQLLKQRISSDMDLDLTQVSNFLSLCEVSFEGFTDEPSTWKLRYDYVSSLINLSLRINNLIKCNHIDACFG